MKTEFTGRGRQAEITPELRRLCEQRLEKLARLLPSLTRAHVILTADKHRQVAEVSVHSRGLDLTAVEVNTNSRASLAGAFEKLLRQTERERARRRVRKGARSPRLTAGAAPEGRSEGTPPRVVRSRRSPVKPMTLDEATLEMDGNGDGVLVFRDAATGRVTVLFRRKDGNLGLIEPEA